MFEKNSRVLAFGEGYVKLSEAKDFNGLWDGKASVQAELTSENLSEEVCITLVNGAQLRCSADTELLSMEKRLNGQDYVRAVDLTDKHLVYLSENSPEFEQLDLSGTQFLSRLEPYDIGVLAALFDRSAGGAHSIDIPTNRTELCAQIAFILTKTGADYTERVYMDRTERIEYTITDDAFFKEFAPFKVVLSFPHEFWKSKSLIRGFMKTMFSFGTYGSEMLIIKDSKESRLLYDIQQALSLFGVNAVHIGGLRVSKLIVSKNNAYRFAFNVGIFSLEELFGPLDYKRFLDYTDKYYSDSRYERVASVKKLSGSISCVGVGTKDIMVNGMLARGV